MTTVRWREQTPLVGREAELSKLADLLQHVRVGHSGVVFVVGEPGIGKTRLLVELAQRARRQDWHVLLGHAYESEGMPPYLPFIEALRDYVRACPPDEARDLLQAITPDVARLLPDVATPLTVSEGDSSLELDTRDPKAHRYRLFEHLCDVLFKIASSSQGLLVCLDDLHWADEPTLQLLLHLVRRLDEAPVLLVCSYRSTASGAGQALTDTLAEMNRQRLCHRLVLDALSRDELGSLITYLGGPATPVVTDMIHRQTGGNPYFACELVRHLQDEGHDLSRGDLTAAEWGVPDGINQVIATRLSRLGPDAQRLLQACAVIGEPLTLELLGTVLNLEPLPLIDAFEEALGAGLLREAGDQHQFSHALVRQAVYRSLTAARRKHLHLAVAGALERVHASALERHLSELAFHYARAGDLAPADKRLAYAEQAGDAANAVFAYEEAVSHWLSALQLMDRHAVEPERRARLLERLGDLMCVAGIDYEAGIFHLERALQLYEQRGQMDRVAHVHIRLGNARSALPESWDLPRAVHHYQRAEAILTQRPIGAALGYVYAGLAQVAIWEVRISDGLDASAWALDIAEQVHDDTLWAHAAMTRGSHLISNGHVSEGLAILHQAWHMADRLNDPVAFTAAFLGSAFAHWIGDSTEVRQWPERELARPRVAHAPGQRKRFLGRLASAHALAGDLQKARSLIDAVGSSYDAWDALFCLGDWQECKALARSRIERSRSGGERAFGFEAAYDLARLRRVQGDVATARDLLQQALSVATEGGERTYELAVRTMLALVCLEMQDLPAADQQLVHARRIATRAEDWRGLGGQLHLAEGAFALAASRPEEAAGHFQRGIEVYRRYATPFAEAEVHLAWSRGLRDTRRTAAATEHVRTAEAIYTSHGAGSAWLERLARVHSTSSPDGLSERELEVLRLVAAGRTNRQIADELVITLNTVARHVSSIFSKTGVANRAEAASYAHRRGLTNKYL